MGAYERIRPSESQLDAQAMPIYRDLRDALTWFRQEWQASLPPKLHESESQVADGDVLGGPAYTERFRRYIFEQPHDPLRRALLSMQDSTNRPERIAGTFLFVLACQDFEPTSAGLRMPVPLAPDYALYYAEKAIARLRERMAQVDKPHRYSRVCAEATCDERTDRLYCQSHRRAA